MTGLQRVSDLLRAAHLDAGLTSQEAIRSLVAERRRATGITTDEAYASLAAKSPSEFAKLREQIAVPETWLFRYPAAFETLRSHFTHSGQKYFRVLSLACANGAEPYSIACAALACGVPATNISILAIDPNPTVLERARKGELGSLAVRSELPSWASPWIVSDKQSARIDPVLRSCIEFREGAAPEALEDLPSNSFDAVFCRNLIIYLNDLGRRTIGAQLDRLLSADGMLFLGHAERPALIGLEEGFQSENDGEFGSFAFVRKSVKSDWPHESPGIQPSGIGVGTGSGAFSYRQTFSGSASADPRSPVEVRTKASTPALPVQWKQPTATNTTTSTSVGAVARAVGSTATEFETARAAANAGELLRANQIADQLYASGVRTFELSELLGNIHLARGNSVSAENAFRQALYLNPQSVEVLMQLALLADFRGDTSLAGIYRQRAGQGHS